MMATIDESKHALHYFSKSTPKCPVILLGCFPPSSYLTVCSDCWKALNLVYLKGRAAEYTTWSTDGY